jgi:hypothetical protein
VYPIISIVTEFRKCTPAVLYRSKEPALPDFSKGFVEVGDVFIVRVFLRPKCSFDFTTSQMYSLMAMAVQLWAFADSLPLASILYMECPSWT